jgi:hypothetical protein
MGANAQTTVPTFTAAQVLTADQMNQSARTGVPVFADTTARDAGFGGSGEKVLAEGQLCYLESTNVVQYYDGAAWATVGPMTVTPRIAQVVNTIKTDAFTTTSATYVDITGYSVTITPTSVSSKILVITGLATSQDSSGRASFTLLRGATAIADSTGFAGSNQTNASFAAPPYNSLYLAISYLDSPNTTSATTYKIQAKTTGGICYINSQNGATTHGNVSTLTVMEYLP